LKPVGENGQIIADAKDYLQDILEEDKKVREAYQALKPVLDNIHESIITDSLNSETAKSIDFSTYFEEYSKGKRENMNTIRELEAGLRSEIGKTFCNTIEVFNKKAKGEKGCFPINKKGEIGNATKEILDYVKDECGNDTNIQNHLSVFKGFFTYFGNYNTNRANYYQCKKEADTAVATRIVGENLPKFCDNIILFRNRKEEYENAYVFLKENNRITQIKDADAREFIEAKSISEDKFDIKYFNECLTQNGIDEYNKIIGHYNSLINLYNQAKKSEKDFVKLKQFKTLFKQIGCGKKGNLFFSIDDEKQLKCELKKLKEYAENSFAKKSEGNEIKTVLDFTAWLREQTSWEGIYWSKSTISYISNEYLENWHALQELLYENKSCFHKNKDKEFVINDVVELSELKSCIDGKILFRERLGIEGEQKFEKLIELLCADIEKNAKDFLDKSESVLNLSDYKKDKNIIVKEWLDCSLNVARGIRNFAVSEKKVNKTKGNSLDSELSNAINTLLYSGDINWFDYYDAIRNFLTKKPQDDAKKQKLKLNFKNPILLGGWSDGQEKNKSSVILRNDGKYFLGILKKRNIFDTEQANNPIYEGKNKNIGRLILKNIAFKTVAGKGFKSEYGRKYSEIDEPITKLQTFIKENYLNKYPLLKQIVDGSYSNKKEFDQKVTEILTECYECDFKPINWSVVLEHIKNKKLYLFEIYSKDFSQNKGIKNKSNNLNLQTLYWQQIFEENSPIQLCGGGEIFFRKSAIDKDNRIIHKANVSIYRRSDKKTESLFNHDIIKDKRFTKEKIQFHIPIKINYDKSDCINTNGVKDIITPEINKEFTAPKISDEILFLGIDRGEKNLVYYSLINQNGEILPKGQGNFNVINEKDYYSDILEKTKSKKKAQQEWGEIDQIKNIKDGYISLVIHEIAEKIKGKNVFIVLEDLNSGFKRSRICFEQQVYQKFETALAKKLNYLVYKDVEDGVGSAAKGLQLTPPVRNPEDIKGKNQLGIMLYVRANYTSVTDPDTGWRKSIYLQKGSEEKIKKQILEKFSEIAYDGQDYFFEYVDKNTNKKWKMWSGKNGKSLERYRSKRGIDKNEFVIEQFDVKEMLDKLFLNFDKSKSLKEQLQNQNPAKINKQDNEEKRKQETAWESLRFVIDLIQQIRNNGDKSKKQDENFLQSPVRNEDGEHFDSRIYQKSEKQILPIDADANGAYNIARKGIIAFEHIKQNIEKHNLFISDEEWDLWLNKRRMAKEITGISKTEK
jgi:CRISPR-associated protein Cpf1